VSPGSELEPSPPRTAVAILVLVRAEIGLRNLLVNLLVRGRVMPRLRSKPGIAVAKVRIGDIGVELFVGTRLEILFTMIYFTRV
jgi:hypothetical protein